MRDNTCYYIQVYNVYVNFFQVSVLTKQTYYSLCCLCSTEVFLRQAEVPFLRPGYGRLLCQYHDRPTQYLKQ